MAYIRKVKTASGATAVQIAHKTYGQINKIEHIGSAHTPDQLDVLMVLAKKRLLANQPTLFPQANPPAFKLRLKQSASRLLWQVLLDQYQKLGFHQLKDDVFASLCLTRLVEPVSKLDSLRVLVDLGVEPVDKNRLYRCLVKVIANNYRETISQACFRYATKESLSLVLYDVTTLYFETQKEDNYRRPGLSKERRLEPQIVVGLLVNSHGFPLGIHSFEGNTAETKTILPVVQSFQSRYGLKQVTVVADAAMMSRTNLEALTDAGYSYVVGSRLNKVPLNLAEYQKNRKLKNGEMVVSHHDSYRIIYQYKDKRARLDLNNIAKQIAKAKRIVAGKAPAHRAKFVALKNQQRQLNLSLIDKAHALAGIKGYVTNLDVPDEQVIDYYHQLFQVEASFRMAKSDLKARPIFHRKRDSIEAHLTIVLAALALGKTIEAKTSISIKQFIKLLRPIRSGTITINGYDYPVEAEIPKVIH
ncbi:MAG: IS1634 family transposase, partial [Patescibacteria group bacterium]|nr:IS1634 family transposase [Patescibacteria group bacterium]